MNEKTMHNFDLLTRPKIIFLHPYDAKQIREANPEIDREIVISVSDNIQQGKGIVLNRTDLEKFY